MKREITLKIIVIRYVLLFFAVLFATFVGLGHCQVSPILGNVGNVQVFDNNGVICPQCVLYSYQAGTTTQQATFTDSTGTVQNPNPITFNGGGRAAIWLTTGAFYKLVLCVQNDGAFCAPSDVLFSSDQVPGGSTGGGVGGGAPFISNSSNPATSGILRLATGDSICWRNAGNSANLCVSKDGNDVLSWAGGIIKMPETVCPPTSASGFDFLCADNTAHRYKMGGNGGSLFPLALQGNDISGSDGVIQFHFGTTATPLSGTPPTTGQFLQWNGTNIIGQSAVTTIAYNTPSASVNASIGATTMTTAGANGDVYRFTVSVLQSAAGVGCTTNTTVNVQFIYTDPASGVANTTQFGTNPTISIGNNGGLGPIYSITPGYVIVAKASTVVQYQVTYVQGTCTTGPKYTIYPILETVQ